MPNKDPYHMKHIHGYPPMPEVNEVTDQLPGFAVVGRGLPGISSYIELGEDSESGTYLIGYSFDPATGESTERWTSKNINGGKLTYSIDAMPDAVPECFTITFTYTRDEREEWEFTTPFIPYLSEDDEGVDATAYLTLNSLSKILSQPPTALQWLINNKELEDDATSEGINGTGLDVTDWTEQAIKDATSGITDSIDELKDYVSEQLEQMRSDTQTALSDLSNYLMEQFEAEISDVRDEINTNNESFTEQLAQLQNAVADLQVEVDELKDKDEEPEPEDEGYSVEVQVLGSTSVPIIPEDFYLNLQFYLLDENGDPYINDAGDEVILAQLELNADNEWINSFQCFYDFGQYDYRILDYNEDYSYDIDVNINDETEDILYSFVLTDPNYEPDDECPEDQL